MLNSQCLVDLPSPWSDLWTTRMLLLIYFDLTHSMEQSPPWDVNRFSASQGILCIHKCLLHGVTSHKTTCSLYITICWKFSWVTYLFAWWIKTLWEYLSYLFIIRSCQMYVNGVLLASSLEKTKKEASRVAAEVGLEKLKETCYTIKVSHITFHSSYHPTSICQFSPVHWPLLSNIFFNIHSPLPVFFICHRAVIHSEAVLWCQKNSASVSTLFKIPYPAYD